MHGKMKKSTDLWRDCMLVDNNSVEETITTKRIIFFTTKLSTGILHVFLNWQVRDRTILPTLFARGKEI